MARRKSRWRHRAALRPGLCALVLAAILAPAMAARAHDLVVALPPDASPAAQTQALVQPFTQALSIPAHAVVWHPPGPDLASHAPGTPDPWDVVQVPGAVLGPACAQGALEKLDWSKIGGKDRLIGAAVTDCGAGAVLSATVLAWDRDKLGNLPPNTVPNWADFWDVAKFPGKRGLRSGAAGNLEIALMADGVSPGDVYSTLRGTAGVDRAFRKLDQLRPYVVWWKDAAQATQILVAGQVLMTSADSAHVVAAQRQLHRAFGMQWSGNLSEMTYWAVLKGSPELVPAESFLAFAGDPQSAARLLPAAALGVPLKALPAGLSPDLAADSPAAPDHVAAALPVDAAFWHDQGPALEARFASWLAAH